MKKQTRIKYLYPTINDERKYKWLENANLEYNILDYDVTQFTLEEFQEKLGIKENYDNWKKHSQKFCRLEPTTVKWNNERIDELAKYLAKNPLYLPYFIEYNATTIIGYFIGQVFLFSESQKMPEKNPKEIWPNQKIDKDEYKRENFKAKYKLSLFLRIIDKLLDLGVNLEELTFVNLEEHNTFNETKNARYWNEYLLKNIKEQNYIRKDDYSFTEQEIKTILNYKNLTEFLDKVIRLTDIEYYQELIEEAITMNPDYIVPFKGYDKMDMSYYKETGVVQIQTICKKMQDKLADVAKTTETIWNKRKREEIQALKEQIQTENYELLLPKLEKFSEEIDMLGPEHQKDVKELEETLIAKGIKLKSKKESEKDRNKSSKELEIRVKELEDSLSKSEERNRSLKNQLRTYRKEKETIKQEFALTERTYQEELTKVRKDNRKKQIRCIITGLVFGTALGCLVTSPYHLNKKAETKVKIEQELENFEEAETEGKNTKIFIKR